MPPRVSLESPLRPYFPHQTPKKHDSQDDVWWQGTEQIRGSPPHRRESSISDVISEWIADSDDFDDTHDHAHLKGEGHLEYYAGEAENENGVEAESEGISNLPRPTEKSIGKGKDKEVATRLPTLTGDRPEDVNDKGEQILLPKAFPGFPADIERRRVLA